MVSLLNANLKEEKAADKKLNGLAEGGINRRATRAGSAIPATPSSIRCSGPRGRTCSNL